MPRAVADEVDPCHLHPHAVGRRKVGRFPVKVGRGEHQPSRQHAVGKDLARSIDIGQERFEGAHALGHARLDGLPLLGRHDPGYEVEGERPLLSRERESYPLVAKAAVPGDAACPVLLGRKGAQDVVQGEVMATGRERVAFGHFEHLVPRRGPARDATPVGAEEVAHNQWLSGLCYGCVTSPGATHRSGPRYHVRNPSDTGR